MGRALHIARSARTLAARCFPVMPPAAASTRLWQHRGVQVSPANQWNTRPGNAPSRFNHTDAHANKTPNHHKKDEKQVQPEEGLVDGKLTFRYPNDGDDFLVLSSLWLRDSCPCDICVDPDSGQKNFSTTDLPDIPEIGDVKVYHEGSLEIDWMGDGPSGGGWHRSKYPAAEVRAWQADSKWQRGSIGSNDPSRILWNRASYEELLAKGRCRVSYRDWMGEGRPFMDALMDLRQTGLIFVTDVPTDENEVVQVAHRIGPVQDTFYGRTWDVRNKARAENVAYTDKFLCLHQDLMYHDPVPGLQLLHCLSNTCEGGESLFSNAVRAADELRVAEPSQYEDLTSIGVYFGYNKGNNHCFKRQTTIVADSNELPRETRWAPPFQTTFPVASGDPTSNKMAEWKKAARAFQDIAESEANMLEVKLKEGECVIFDNRQILHGRRQFAAGQGSRWLKGTYVSHQDYIARTEWHSKQLSPPVSTAEEAGLAGTTEFLELDEFPEGTEFPQATESPENPHPTHPKN